MDDVRAAAEELLRELNGLGDSPREWIDLNAVSMVAKAYLAANPADDGEPVIASRLPGFEPTDNGQGVKRRLASGCYLFVLHNCSVGVGSRQEWADHYHEIAPAGRTLQQVRVICTALGVPLRAGAKE
jgi:hypothetical protein